MIHQIFTGPVNAAQAKGAILRGASAHWITCTGDGHPSCADLAAGWRGADGRILPGLLASQKIVLEQKDELWAGAFSAGGQIWKRVMENEADRAELAGAILSDAGYEAGWKDEQAKAGLPVEGYVEFALDALRDGRLFVWTASATPNVSTAQAGVVYPSGAQTMEATRLAIESRGGKALEDVTAKPELWPWGARLRPPAKVWRLANVIFADYGSAYSHTENVTVIAPEIWQSIPAILASGPRASSGSWFHRLGPWGQLGVIVGGSAALIFGGRALLGKKR